MKTYNVSVTVNFAIEATSPAQAEDRAGTIIGKLTSGTMPDKGPKWFDWDSINAEEPSIEEA